MSDESLSAQVNELKRVSQGLSEAMLGKIDTTTLEHRPGALHIIDRLVKDCYGEEGRPGYFDIVRELDRRSQAQQSFLRGANFVSAAIGGFIGFILPILVELWRKH